MFERLGVFTYSDEEISESYKLDGKVDGRTIYNRKRRLLAIQRRISRSINAGMVGRTMPLLVEGVSGESDLLWEGRLATQAPEIDGICYINDLEGAPLASGQIRPFEITEAHDYDLVGRVLDTTEAERAHLPLTGSRPDFPIFPQSANPPAHRGVRA